jgi:hypothetical protein
MTNMGDVPNYENLPKTFYFYFVCARNDSLTESLGCSHMGALDCRWRRWVALPVFFFTDLQPIFHNLRDRGTRNEDLVTSRGEKSSLPPLREATSR